MINVVDPVTRMGYRFKGHAEVHVEGSVFDDVVAFYQRERQIAPARVRGVAMMIVEQAAPLVSPSYDIGLKPQRDRCSLPSAAGANPRASH